MSAEIISIEAHRPHFSVHDPIDNKTHVVPTRLVASIIDGSIDSSVCDQSMIRALLRYLLEIVADE